MLLSALLLVGCGDPLDDVFASHEAQLTECLGYRAKAEAMDASAAKAKRNTLGGGAARLEAQSDRHIAQTLHRTHDACLTRLFEAAAASAKAEGLSRDELQARWPAWYDAKAAAHGPSKP